MGAGIYLLSPIDFIPEFLLLFFGLGFLDGAFLIFVMFDKLLNESPQDVVREHIDAIRGDRTLEETFGSSFVQRTQSNEKPGQTTVILPDSD